MTRYYSAIAVDNTVGTAITNASTTLVLTSSPVGYPTNYPFVLALDYNASLEELVQVTNVSGTTLTNTLQANTANIANVLVDSSNVSIPLDLIVGRNANVIGNVASVNVTNRLFVGGDSFLYGNVTISGNVTLDSVGYDDLDVAGSVNSTNLNTSTANITLLTGTSNTAIYTTISAAIDSSIAFAIALG